MPSLRTSLVVAAALIAHAALAQDAPGPTAPPKPPMAKPMPFDTNQAFAKPGYVAKQDTSEWMSSDFVGKDVYGPDREKVGAISDLLFDKTGGMVAAVVGVGGFLGVGEKEVAVPFSEFQFSTQGGKRVITMNATREALRSAPSFKRSESSG